jgi:zinc transporter, ZIP family
VIPGGLGEVLIVAIASDLATALGVLPVVFLESARGRWHGLATAAAGGMMLSASMFALADEALRRGSALSVTVGMIAGAAFFAAAARYITTREWRLGDWNVADSRQPILLVLTMFVHSAPEGLAIGVGYATGETRFGLLLALAIAVHNIPEGTAVALPLRARGASIARCAWYAVLTSLPQPILAVPAYMLTSLFQPLVGPSLGFAGGAMIFLVVSELLPESLAAASRIEVGWAFTLGLVGMLAFTAALGL